MKTRMPVIFVMALMCSLARGQGTPKPHLVIVTAEDEYDTEKTLPKFAAKHLPEYRTTHVTADAKNKNHLPEIKALESADVLILSVRRRPLVEADLKIIKDYVARQKPIVAIRTSSHAFAPKKGESIPAGIAMWESFDRDVLGCHYTGHHSNKLKTTVTRTATEHPIMAGVAKTAFDSPSWLYKSSPLLKDCILLCEGKVEGQPVEPVAWAREKADGHGRVFYTSLGHKGDFDSKEFKQMLKNAVAWVQGK